MLMFKLGLQFEKIIDIKNTATSKFVVIDIQENMLIRVTA
jgi:hypothetical protein